MTTSNKPRSKRTQRDYTLAFKLGVVERNVALHRSSVSLGLT